VNQVPFLATINESSIAWVAGVLRPLRKPIFVMDAYSGQFPPTALLLCTRAFTRARMDVADYGDIRGTIQSSARRGVRPRNSPSSRRSLPGEVVDVGLHLSMLGKDS